MDEEKQYTTNSDRSHARPSMVVMTNKLLNVTEGMAAMNVRVACGVALCIVLLVATFIVNVIAFDYARDNEVSNGALVDKATGRPVVVADTVSLSGPAKNEFVLDETFLRGVKNVELTGTGHNMLSVPSSGFTIFACNNNIPEALQAEYCDLDGYAYLVFAGELIAYYKSNDGKLVTGIVDAADATELVNSGVTAVAQEHRSRQLLSLTHTAYYEECVMSPNSPLNTDPRSPYYGQSCEFNQFGDPYCSKGQAMGSCTVSVTAQHMFHDEGETVQAGSFGHNAVGSFDAHYHPTPSPTDPPATPSPTPAPPPCRNFGQTCNAALTCCSGASCNGGVCLEAGMGPIFG